MGWNDLSIRKLQRCMMTSYNGNIFRITGPLWREFTSHRWIPCTKANDGELWRFLWSVPWMNSWVNNPEACDLRRHRAHYDVPVMCNHWSLGMDKLFHPALYWACDYLSKVGLKKLNHGSKRGHGRNCFKDLFGSYRNSLWPNDAIQCFGSLSTLIQVMVSYLTAPSHYANQHWLIMNELIWYLQEILKA